MKKEYEAQYHLLEETHWWFQGRRQLVHSLVLQLNADKNCRILEIGCSGGPLLQQLWMDGYVNVAGIDISAEAIQLCQRRGMTDTHIMDAQKPSFGDECFDLIIASDVLEHLADRGQALREWYRLLRPNGMMIIFVPAFMFLWSRHDEVNNHFRRYCRPELNQLLIENGFMVKRSLYWNFLLFFPVALVRSFKRQFQTLPSKSVHGDLKKPANFVNQFLFRLLRWENQRILHGINWPFGVSVMALGVKNCR